ncbi:leukocyte receptor cluster member 1 homolog [Pogonomyrmex barbatus]|uniref:Leukocyte receptor cluster member 1 homolog n=1 Tax=Pogonomyrmex barbatus TaxID=144034 RepID=A0A6I9WAX9_9HYME|nr:leukocyte receptor cluster member 1 homolog [Pogonomyrmex barbatus]
MNILPKKRWHVRTKENIARVRRDEAKAAEEEKVKQARLQKATTEARLDLLRHRAKFNHKDHTDISDTTNEKLEHVNFFEDLECGKIDYNRPNLEHEREKKEEKEKYEKQIGYLTYLGQNTNEATGKKNWYEELPMRIIDTEKDVEIDALKKASDDPLIVMKKYVDNMPHKQLHSQVKAEMKPMRTTNYIYVDESTDLFEQVVNKRFEKFHEHEDEHKHTHKHKHKHSKKKRYEITSSTDLKKVKERKFYLEEYERQETLKILSKRKGPMPVISPKTSIEHQTNINIERLRTERLLREQSEQLRTQALIAKMKGGPMPIIPSETSEPAIKPAIKQKYNSQFFPELARQNAERTPKYSRHNVTSF